MTFTVSPWCPKQIRSRKSMKAMRDPNCSPAAARGAHRRGKAGRIRASSPANSFSNFLKCSWSTLKAAAGDSISSDRAHPGHRRNGEDGVCAGAGAGGCCSGVPAVRAQRWLRRGACAQCVPGAAHVRGWQQEADRRHDAACEFSVPLHSCCLKPHAHQGVLLCSPSWTI